MPASATHRRTTATRNEPLHGAFLRAHPPPGLGPRVSGESSSSTSDVGSRRRCRSARGAHGTPPRRPTRRVRLTSPSGACSGSVCHGVNEICSARPSAPPNRTAGPGSSGWRRARTARRPRPTRSVASSIGIVTGSVRRWTRNSNAAAVSRSRAASAAPQEVGCTAAAIPATGAPLPTGPRRVLHDVRPEPVRRLAPVTQRQQVVRALQRPSSARELVQAPLPRRALEEIGEDAAAAASSSPPALNAT